MSHRLPLAAALCLLAAGLSAQRPLLGRPRAFVEESSEWAWRYIPADFDADGDVDLIDPDTVRKRLLINEGTGRFREAGEQRLSPRPLVAAAAGDLDGDGDVDLLGLTGLLPILQPQFVRYRNDGKGTFTEEFLLTPGWGPGAFRLFDADGDGDLDLITFQGPQHDRLGLNDGRGGFQDVTATHLPPQPPLSRMALAADFDGDGDADLILEPGTQPPRFFENDGRGRYRDVTAAKLGSLYSQVTSRLADLAVDVDQDKDLDLVVLGPTCRVFLNDGLGAFSVTRFLALPPDLPTVDPPFFAIALDADRNGAVDLLLSRSPGEYGRDRWVRALLLNNGLGSFVDASPTHLPDREHGFVDPIAVDVDADGDADLVGTDSKGGAIVHLNDARGHFSLAPGDTLPTTGSLGFDMLRLTAGDLDGDGHVDLVGWVPSGQREGKPIASFWRNDGYGRLEDASAGNIPVHDRLLGDPRFLYVQDLDADRDLDLVIALTSGGWVLLNDGRGRFARTAYSGSAAAMFAGPLAFGDFDIDGDVDWIAQPGILAVNDGKGSFTRRSTSIHTVGYSTPISADLDGDRDVDLVLSLHPYYHNGAQGLVLFNDGNLSFRAGQTVQIDAPSGTDWMLVDIDRDGDPDLLARASGAVLENDGKGTFRPAPERSLPRPVVAVADIDGDTVLDFVTSEASWLGVWLGRTLRPYAVDRSRDYMPEALRCGGGSVVLADLDNDRDLDFVVAGCLRHVFTNLATQLAVSGHMGAGKTTRVEVFGPSGMPCAIFASPLPANLEIPGYGVLRLSPAGLVAWHLTFLSTSTPGYHRTELPVPAQAALVGQTVYFQALVVEWGPLHWRLTNADTLRISAL